MTPLRVARILSICVSLFLVFVPLLNTQGATSYSTAGAYTPADGPYPVGAQCKLSGLGSLREMVDDPEAWTNRVRDVTFTLDSFERRIPSLKGKLDAGRIGVGGHSFGPYTTMLVGDMTVDVPGGAKAQSYADPRPRAFLVISGQGRDKRGLTEHSWERFTRPMMNITGSLDRGISGQDPSWRKEPYEFSPPGDKYQVFIQDANHMTFTGLPAEMGRQPEALFDIARIASIAFWDAYLKESKNARGLGAGGPTGRQDRRLKCGEQRQTKTVPTSW